MINIFSNEAYNDEYDYNKLSKQLLNSYLSLRRLDSEFRSSSNSSSIDDTYITISELKSILCTEDSCLYYNKCRGEKCSENSCIMKVIEDHVRKKGGY